MDYLQYRDNNYLDDNSYISFKPCYKWITFNTRRIDNNLDKVNDYKF